MYNLKGKANWIACVGESAAEFGEYFKSRLPADFGTVLYEYEPIEIGQRTEN